MRITIEDSDSKSLAAAAAAGFNNPSQPGATLTPIDAGAPAASLLQATTASAIADATDAGTPPESLVQALQNTSALNNSTSSRQSGDAGGAPTI